MKDKIKEVVENETPRWWSRRLTNEQKEWLFDQTGVDNLTQAVCLAVLDQERGTCKECGKPTRWRGVQRGYDETCSRSCRERYKVSSGRIREIQEKIQLTSVERYGTRSPMQNKSIRDKARKTNLERYGATCVMNAPKYKEERREAIRSPERREKIRKVMIERYGVENPGQLPGHMDHVKEVFKEKHGVDHWSKIPKKRWDIIKKREEKWNKKFPNLKLLEAHDLFYGTPNSSSKVKVQCRKCGIEEEFLQSTLDYRSTIVNNPCTNCSGITTARSLKEQSIGDFIEDLGFSPEYNNRTIIGTELDIVVHEKNLAIEFCGLFWHRDVDSDSRYRHQRKLDLCEGVGIDLLTIFEDEYDYHPDKVFGSISHALGVSDRKKVGARSCNLDYKVPTKEARSFFDEHHIQGYSNAKYKIGLRYDGKLVACMTFSKPSRAKGGKREVSEGEWELNRFATSCRVPGGASRLFNAFVNSDVTPSVVFSYADRRWSNGNLYRALGMEHLGTTPPNYWYFKKPDLTRHHRFALRKGVVPEDDLGLTEWENRQIQGWDRIWDCGSHKFIWTKDK